MRRIAARNSRSAAAWAAANSAGRNADRLGRELGLVDPGRIVEHGRQALLAHVAADPLDDLGGESGSPKTSIVRRRPASLTTSPRGLSRSRSAASAAAHRRGAHRSAARSGLAEAWGKKDEG